LSVTRKNYLTLTLQELEKEALCRMTVTPGLDEDVDPITVLIDPTNRTPEILPFAVDRNEDFVEEPCIPETTLTSF
jgi:hypothetical protein